MTDKQIIIGTSGHVDHGKTSLLHAITGIDADRWVEEKERGITIDIGFAHLEEEGLSLSFIDVPGHKDFVTNMLSGIFSIDMAVLIVAADESVMPQTKEHFSILSFLGIKTIIPVITKIDIADEEMIELTELEIAELFENANLTIPEKYFKLSSKTMEGIKDFKDSLLKIGQQIEHENIRPFHLPVDRSFSIKGHGTVVTGTLMSGEVKVDEKVYVFPSHKEATVKNITTHQNKVSTAICKKRAALNLPQLKKDEVKRGEIIVKRDFNLSTNLADVVISIDDSVDYFENLKRVRISIGTDDVIARVKLIEKKGYEPPFTAMCQLRFEHPVACFNGQKFIIRSYSPVYTIGGGTVLLSKTTKRKGFKKCEKYLEKLAFTDISKKIEGIMEVKKVLSLDDIGNLLFLKKSIVETHLEKPLKDNIIKKIETKFVYKEHLDEISNKVIDSITAYQKENTMKKGMPASLIPDKSSFALNLLIKQGDIIKEGAFVKTADFKMTLTKKEQENYNKFIQIIDEGKFAPPLVLALEKDFGKNTTDFIALALIENKIFRISSELYFSAKTYKNFIENFKNFSVNRTVFEVKDFKEIFNVSRKYIIPMLEFLDGEQLISRENDVRKILKENVENYKVKI